MAEATHSFNMAKDFPADTAQIEWFSASYLGAVLGDDELALKVVTGALQQWLQDVELYAQKIGF